MSLGKSIGSGDLSADDWSAAFSPASFTWPDRLGPSLWLEHAPFGAWLIDAIKPEMLVELGTYDGFSYSLFCQAVNAAGMPTRCWAIGQWQGDVRGEEAFEALDTSNGQYHASFSRLVRGTSDEMAPRFRDGTIDLLHIDSVRSYEAARTDFKAWLPKMSQRGVILFHGIAPRDHDADISRFWQELKLSYPCFAFPHGLGLGVVSVGPTVREPLSQLFGSAGESRTRIQQGYERLGRAISDSYALTRERENQKKEQTQRELLTNELTRSQEKFASLLSDLDDSRRLVGALEQTLAEQEEAQCTQASSLHEAQDTVREMQQQVDHLKASASWRITGPLRLANDVIRKPSALMSRMRGLTAQVLRSVRLHGVRATVSKVARALPSGGFGKLLRTNASATAIRWSRDRLPVPTRAANRILSPRILIIAEVSIPQCLKYRVIQKQAMLESLGYECTVLRWKDVADCLHALQTHSVVIFYRVPAFPEVVRVIDEAKALRLPTFWEVDDIIFDAEMYRTNLNLEDISAEDLRGVLQSVPLYREAMLACDAAIASTEGVAAAMRAAGVENVWTVENALDTQTLEIADAINATPRDNREYISIVYGSGTKTHDADFRVVAPALHRLLLERADVRLCIAGELNLPPNFSELASQIERLPLVDYPRYIQWLAAGDISIAPLEPGIFNDAKSNIKYLEAAVVKLPSVCSPRAAFRTAIEGGVTGFLADSTIEWYDALLRLVDDPALREMVGRRAHAAVVARYAPMSIAIDQVAPVVAPFDRAPGPLRVLGVNVYFAPRSFGGATVIAEEMAKRLNLRDDTEYAVFTALPVDGTPAYQLTRYETNGTTVFAMGLPPISSESRRDFENPASLGAFRDALKALRPDIVHLHSVQGIGAQIAAVCQEEGVRYAATLHDAWWICGRQFMVNNKHRFCDQKKIDLSVCATCVPDAQLNSYRQKKLAGMLRSASLLLAPSAYFKDLYIANGVDSLKIRVNKNGILPPRHACVRRMGPPDGRLRFGYVGGNTDIKGVQVIKAAFSKLIEDNYRLVLVDNMLNMGGRSILPADWKQLRGQVEIVPAYTQENIDEFFERIDVLLFPTQWKESFGLTVREASIRNVWVITTDAGGVVEDIVEGENGTIIPLSDDGTQLCEAVEALLVDSVKLQSFENPYSSTIRLFDEQAAELRDMLADAARRPRRVVGLMQVIDG